MSDPFDLAAQLVEFPYDSIQANPYQHYSARRFRGPDFDELVESIRVNGVFEAPRARLHPTIPNAIQLETGHRRLAASRIARPGEMFRVVLQPIADIEMFENCVSENLHREGLNDIERAEMIEEYKKLKPDATNADMARVFRLKDPASVSNIRKLLRLPPAIQQHVAADALPDAIARQLVGISTVNAKTAQKIADEVAAAPKSEKQDAFEHATRNLYWNQLIDLEREHGWSLDWLADAPVTVEPDLGDGDHVIGACGGCVFNVGDKCARKACFAEKFKLWAAAEVQRVAAKKQIAIAGPDEPMTILFTGEYFDDDRAQELLNARKEIKKVLRLAPLSEPAKRYSGVLRVLDSNAVTLVTTDKNAIDAYFAERHAAAKSNRTNTASASLSTDKDEETDAEKAKRIAQEKKEMDAKRAARSAMWKSYYDAKWLLEHAAREIGMALADCINNDVFAAFVESQFVIDYNAYGAAEDIENRLIDEIRSADKPFTATQLRMANVVLHVIAADAYDVVHSVADYQQEFMFERVREVILEYCGEGKKSRVHKGMLSFGIVVENFENWDVPPVHHTAFNCWQCGRFAGNMQEKLTQRDINEEGWIDDGKDGVFCSVEHKTAYAQAQVLTPQGGIKQSSKIKGGAQHAKEKSKRAAKAPSKRK